MPGQGCLVWHFLPVEKLKGVMVNLIRYISILLIENHENMPCRLVNHMA